jgi:hypothetical protein
MESILLEEAYRTIKVNEGAGQISVPMAQAVIRSLAVNAARATSAHSACSPSFSSPPSENKCQSHG